MANSSLKDIIQTAKSIPPALYHLILLNIVMFIGFVIKDLTVLYLFGSLAFVTLLIAAIGKISGLWQTPSELISENVHTRMI